MTAELRRRKLKSQHVGPASKKNSKDKEASSIQRSLICLIICATILILFFGIYVDTWEMGHKAVDHLAKSLGYHEPVYAVVIDAGSTGSRVLAFSFHKAYLDGRLVLDDELFVETKPGLSSFAKNPEKSAQSINKLLEQAKQKIPKKYWSQTPLTLKATAGLRLLPAHQAEDLLDAVRALFEKSLFHTTPESVAIMDGVDEGIFSWFTVNFLLDRLSANPDRTVAALDLGGGSTQVTFAPTTPSTLKQTDYIHNVQAVKGTIPVYTHSYLGLGLMAARKEILTYGHESDKKNLSSHCVNPFISNKKFHYSGVDYYVSGNDATVRGDSDPVVDFYDCTRIIIDYVYSKVIPLEELHTKQINAFSYYFDRATEYGLIDPFTGGIVTVEQFMNAAKDACATINVDQPFMCLDLSYIWVLLEHGFGLKPATKLNLFKKIQGHEISWALGAAFNILKSNN
ncbi:NTPase [Carabus blaptoides fortunei]